MATRILDFVEDRRSIACVLLNEHIRNKKKIDKTLKVLKCFHRFFRMFEYFSLTYLLVENEFVIFETEK